MEWDSFRSTFSQVERRTYRWKRQWEKVTVRRNSIVLCIVLNTNSNAATFKNQCNSTKSAFTFSLVSSGFETHSFNNDRNGIYFFVCAGVFIQTRDSVITDVVWLDTRHKIWTHQFLNNIFADLTVMWVTEVVEIFKKNLFLKKGRIFFYILI